jgi:hypothetical protein
VAQLASAVSGAEIFFSLCNLYASGALLFDLSRCSGTKKTYKKRVTEQNPDKGIINPLPQVANSLKDSPLQ